MQASSDELQPTLNPNSFSNEVRAARLRLERLSAERLSLSGEFSTGEENARIVDEENEYLWKTQEELQVAEDELRQQAEALFAANVALDFERRRYEELFQNAPDAYIITDLRGVIIEVNRAAEFLLGLGNAGVQGKPLVVFVPPEARADFRARAKALSEPHSPQQQWECDLRTPRGRNVPVAISATQGRDMDVTQGSQTVRWLIRDLSELLAAEARAASAAREVDLRVSARTAELEGLGRQKESLLNRERERRLEAERLQRRNAELLHVLGHELRTPVAAAQGYVELLERGSHGSLTADQQEDIARIGRCNDHLLHVLDSVLAHSRLESGEVEVERADVPVNEALSMIRQYFDPQLLAGGIEYTYEGGDQTVTVRADRGLMHQILLNLMTNAVRFTPPGGQITLSMSVDPDHVSMSVRDTGCGIPAESLDRIFEPFVQLRRGAHGSGTGAGLGLAISRRIASAMGGELTVESTVGEGSTFTLALPRSDPGAKVQ